MGELAVLELNPQHLPEPQDRRLTILARDLVDRPTMTDAVAQLGELVDSTDPEYRLVNTLAQYQ